MRSFELITVNNETYKNQDIKDFLQGKDFDIKVGLLDNSVEEPTFETFDALFPLASDQQKYLRCRQLEIISDSNEDIVASIRFKFGRQKSNMGFLALRSIGHIQINDTEKHMIYVQAKKSRFNDYYWVWEIKKG